MSPTFHCLQTHLVFATEDRSPWIGLELEPRLYSYLRSIAEGEKARLLAIGGMPDHVHLLISTRPSAALSTLVQKLKGSSSRWLNQSGLIPERFSWQEGYGAFSVSRSQLGSVLRYIGRQKAHHRRRSASAEWTALLARHGLSEEPRPEKSPSGDDALS